MGQAITLTLSVKPSPSMGDMCQMMFDDLYDLSHHQRQRVIGFLGEALDLLHSMAEVENETTTFDFEGVVPAWQKKRKRGLPGGQLLKRVAALFL